MYATSPASMVARTLQHTVFKLLSLRNVVAFDSLRPTELAIKKCTHTLGGGGGGPLAPPPWLRHWTSNLLECDC